VIKIGPDWPVRLVEPGTAPLSGLEDTRNRCATEPGFEPENQMKPAENRKTDSLEGGTIGYGRSIKVMTGPWIRDSAHGRICAPQSQGAYHINVNSLMLENKRQWDAHKEEQNGQFSEVELPLADA
ncbi:hypothetical protein L195_g036819, partial [Trifolium pratense]